MAIYTTPGVPLFDGEGAYNTGVQPVHVYVYRPWAGRPQCIFKPILLGDKG